jgi:hypothetical protein
MGNVTDTMANPLKYFLRLSVALVVLAGLSAGPALGQTVFLDPSLTGSGGDGSQATPYQSGQFQDALDDAAPSGEIVVLNSGALNAPQGTGDYMLDLTSAGGQTISIKSEDANVPGASRDLEVDLPLRVDADNSGDQVRLFGVDVDLGGNALDLGGNPTASVRTQNNAGGTDSPGSIVFSEQGSEVQTTGSSGSSVFFDRLVVTSGAETTFQTPTQSTVTVTDSLDIAGTLDLGSTNTLVADVENGLGANADDPTVNISGTVQNGVELRLGAADDPDGPTFTVGGGGTLENVDFDVFSVADDETDITLEEGGSFTVSANDPAGADGEVVFSNLTTANDFTITGSAPTRTEVLTTIEGTLTIDHPNADFTSEADLTVEGPSNFAATSPSSALFQGRTIFDDDVVVADSGNATVSLQGRTTFGNSLIFSDAGTSGTATLELLAPGIEDFGALNDYDLNNVTGSVRGDATVVEGNFTADAGSNGVITLNDDSGNDNGIHNLRFADDISLGDPNNLNVTTNGNSRVLFTGFSQEITFNGLAGTLSIRNVDILSSDAVNGEVEIERNGQPNRTMEVDGRLRLLGGLFSTEGALDARGATVVRRIAEAAEGTISGGGTSDFAYTDSGVISNGGGGTDLPDEIVYMGGEEPNRTADDGRTGPELPDLVADAAQSVPTLATRSPATITVDVDNGRGSNAEYTVDRLAARAGTFDLATDVSISNGGTVERLNGTIAEGDGSLNYPSINTVGGDGVILEYSATAVTPDAEFDSGTPPEGSVFPYENEEITTGDEFDTDSDAILDVNVLSAAAATAEQSPGAATVALADTDSFYRFNRDALVGAGAALGFNGETLQMNTVEGDDNDFRVVNNGIVASADGSLLEFAGRGEADVTGDVNGSANSPEVFTFPAIAVDKPDDVDSDTEARRVLFQMDNSATDEADGFEFNGNFTITNAQNWSPSDPLGGPDPDGVEFESLGSAEEDVDVVRVTGNFTQSSGSVLAFDQHTGSEFTVDGDFTKNAAASSRFYAGGTSGSVATFEVGGDLEQANGTFYTIIAGSGSFDVDGDVINNSPDKWPASQTSGFESDAFEVDGGTDATASVGGSVTQDTTGTPVFDDPTTNPIENEGFFLVEGFTGSAGEVEVGDPNDGDPGNFNHVEGTTQIRSATTVDVETTVSVDRGEFYANLGSTNQSQRFRTTNLVVADTDEDTAPLFETSWSSGVQSVSGTPTNPEPGLTDQIRVSAETDVQSGGQFALEGFELRQGGNFTLLGTGDAPEASVNDSRAAGLRGLVRFVNDGDTRQVVTTDETPSTYFHGLAVDASGDVELASNVLLNTAAGGQGDLSTPAPSTKRPFGTLFLEDGDLFTTGDTLTVLQPTPTSGGDLIEAVSADETSDAGNPSASPVLGGSNSTKVIGAMRRALAEKLEDTGGQVTDGYVFPLGETERPEYRALVLDLPTDESEPEFFTVTSGEDPEEPLPDGLTSVDAFNANETIDLNVQSLPYFRVESDDNPDFSSFNMRVIAALRPNRVNEVRQLRLIQRNGDWQEAGTYDRDAGSNIDDDPLESGGPNADISGFRNVVHEGVNLDDGNIIGIASDQSINPLDEEGGVLLSGTVIYGDEGEGIGGVDVTATGEDTTATTTTDSDGSYSFAGLPAGSYDVTADPSGQPQGINATDALLAVRDFAGIEDLSDFQEEVADVNDSGDVNATDALLIAQFNLGNVSEFEAGTFASTRDSIDVTTGADDVEIQVAAYGDVNLSGSIGSSSPNTLATTTVDDLGSTTAKTASVRGSEQDGISVPLSVDRNVELGAYTLSIDYPADKVNFEGVSSEDVLVRDADGTVHLAWFDRSGDQPLSLNAGDAFVTMQFTPAEGAENSTLELGNITGELAGADATTLSGTGLQVPEIGLGGPESFAFDGNYPNPVGQRTTISFDLPEQADVSLEVYDVLGRKVMTIPKQSMSAGADRSLSVDASGLSSGTYLYRLQVEMGDQTIRETDQMNVVR